MTLATSAAPRPTTTTHPCGCVLAVDAASGVLKSLSKCPKHRAGARDPKDLDEGYYGKSGLIRDGFLVPSRHVIELVEALGPLPEFNWPCPGCKNSALEVGCGVSPYYPAIRRAGWHYRAIEPSAWAADWMRVQAGAVVHQGYLEDYAGPAGEFGMVLAAHVLEHATDAPAALARCVDLLASRGTLLIVVPDDSDLFNSDHMWFFTPETLRGCAVAAGLTVERLEVRRYVAHERFLYVRARKL